MDAGAALDAAVARGTAHKEVCRTVQSLPESAESAAPLGPVVFGGFFCAPTKAFLFKTLTIKPCQLAGQRAIV